MRATETNFVGLAQPRLYDRQDLRLPPAVFTTNPDETVGLAEVALHGLPTPQHRRVQYSNGANCAARSILHLAYGHFAELEEVSP